MKELLAKYFTDEASQDERLFVESWRSQSPENAKAFLEAKNIWLISKPTKANIQEDTSSIFDHSTKKNFQYYLLNTHWIKYAAAAVLILAIGLLFILNTVSEEPSVFSTKTLADGSTITLYGAAKLDVLVMSDDRREVQVEGTAYFEIEEDENRPFIIHTKNARVKVLGTSFVVNSHDTQTEVCVESGQVELLKINKNIAVKLEGGEMGLVLDSNVGIIKKKNEPNYLAWKTRLLTFNETEMWKVKEVIQSVYGIRVVFDNPDFQKCRFTATFKEKKSKEALEIIARTFNVEFDYEEGVATFKGKGC